MAEVLYPPKIVQPAKKVLFIAGPIQGAPRWQDAAIEYFQPHDHFQIACPRRPQGITKKLEGDDYNAQVDWEHYYLHEAHSDGVLMFWLAHQTTETPGRAYAQTSRLELGEALALHYLTGSDLVVGIEQGFSNERYIRRTLQKKCPTVAIHSDLFETCAHALRLIRS